MCSHAPLDSAASGWNPFVFLQISIIAFPHHCFNLVTAINKQPFIDYDKVLKYLTLVLSIFNQLHMVDCPTQLVI